MNQKSLVALVLCLFLINEKKMKQSNHTIHTNKTFECNHI